MGQLPLAACSPDPDQWTAETLAPPPAPLQLRDGVTVTVDGARYEVRRTRMIFVLGPLASYIDENGIEVQPVQPSDREDPAGYPAVAVSGIVNLPEGWGIAERAIALACGFDEVGQAAEMGFEIEEGTRPDGPGGDVFYPLQHCPALDG